MSSSHSESEVKKAQPNRLEYSGGDSELHQKIFGSLHHCMRCKYFTRSIFSLQNHIKRHKIGGQDFSCECSTPEKYFCTECTFSTFLKTYFNRHIREYHRLKKENESKLDLKIQKCQECQFWTYSSLVLLKHQSSNECFNGETSTEKRKAIVTCVFEDGVKWYICHHCKCRTKNKIHLRDHILYRHTPNRMKWYKCDECDYKAKKRRELKTHITAHHTPLKHIKWYSCDQCEYRNQHSSNLKYHMYHHHSCDLGITLHHCDQCDYKTTYGRNLKRHKVAIHKTDIVESLQCNFCNYKTIYSPDLQTHIKCKHKRPEDIEWFSCDQCAYTAKTSRNLIKHKRNKHLQGVKNKKSFECDHCGYVTNHRGDLKKHMLNKHTTDEDINWFKCGQCEYKCKSRSNLKKHLETHSDVKKFRCDQCDYGSVRKGDLKRHFLKKHF